MDETILHYKIIEKLGEGGMGVVYKAEDIKLKRIVALKFLPKQSKISEQDEARFLQEAQAAAALNHPNICVIHAIEDDNGQQFIAMEYVDGVTLREKIAQNPMLVAQAVGYGIQIGEALQEAHGKGIVHRDIKADNIMVNSKNQVKVMDFGLAKLKGAMRLTRTASTVGTLAYMAPEQIQGGIVDARSDIFSFGVLLYEMLTAHFPFRGEHDAAMMYSILNEDPEPLQKYLSDVPAEIQNIIDKALEKDPDVRYQTCQDIVVDLRRLQRKSSRISRQVSAEMAVPEVAIKKEQEDFNTTKKQKATAGTSISSNKKKKLVIGSSAIGVLVLMILGYFLFINKPINSEEGKLIAVLPFKNLSSDKNDEYFSDGITEDITVELSQIGDLKVIARNAVMKYKNSDVSIKEIGNDLGVSSILEGSIQKEGNEVRIVAQLVDVKTGEYPGQGLMTKS